MADHHLAAQHQLIRNIALVMAGELGAARRRSAAGRMTGEFAQRPRPILRPAGHGAGARGTAPTAEVHALCHWINHAAAMRQSISSSRSIKAQPGHADRARAPCATIWMRGDRTLLLSEPTRYDAPGDLHLADAIGVGPVHGPLGLYDDETAARCTWHLPLSHPLESWSDLRAFDGTASIVQPLIRPLYDTRTAHELLRCSAAAPRHLVDIVPDLWRHANPAATADFDAWWRQTLQDGVVADSAARTRRAPAAKLTQICACRRRDGFTLTLVTRPAVLRRQYGQQCLAAGMSEAVHQTSMG